MLHPGVYADGTDGWMPDCYITLSARCGYGNKESVFEILTAGTFQRVNTHHRANFGADQSSHCSDTVVFLFLKMATVCHFGSLKF